MRTVRSLGSNLKYHNYIDYTTLMEEANRMGREDKEVVTVNYMKPNTFENRSLIGFTLKSDIFSKKPGILVIGGTYISPYYHLSM